jgi:hypothetical protein
MAPIAPRSRHIGPLSRASTLAKLDRRTKEARHLAAVVADLTRHIGQPSATEAFLIQRCAWLSLRVALFDERMVGRDDLSAHAFNAYIAWSNALTRTLARLGLNKAAQEPNPPWPPESSGQPVTEETARAAYFRMLKWRPSQG